LLFWLLYCRWFSIYRYWLRLCYFDYCIVDDFLFTDIDYVFVLLAIVLSMIFYFPILITSLFFWLLYCRWFSIYRYWLRLFSFDYCIVDDFLFTDTDYVFVLLIIVLSMIFYLPILITSLLFWLLYCRWFSIYRYWLRLCFFDYCIVDDFLIGK
jgi:hypothetical protein